MNELMVTIAHDFWRWFGLPPEPVGEQLEADEKALGVDRRRYLQRVLMARYQQVLEGPGSRRSPARTEGSRVGRSAWRQRRMERITTHGLRHTFASHLVMRGASLKAVQELPGHESIEMTLRYSHLTPDVKRDAVRLLDRSEFIDTCGAIAIARAAIQRA